jgi:hypothetical protein
MPGNNALWGRPQRGGKLIWCELLRALGQVTAKETGSGLQQSITITAEKGRLSQAEIDRMVQDAEESAEVSTEHSACVGWLRLGLGHDELPSMLLSSLAPAVSSVLGPLMLTRVP